MHTQGGRPYHVGYLRAATIVADGSFAPLCGHPAGAALRELTEAPCQARVALGGSLPCILPLPCPHSCHAALPCAPGPPRSIRRLRLTLAPLSACALQLVEQISLGFVVALLAHVWACLWFFVGSTQHMWVVDTTVSQGESWVWSKGLQDSPEYVQYVAALYWAFVLHLYGAASVPLAVPPTTPRASCNARSAQRLHPR